MHPNELWNGRSARARLTRLALSPLSGLYALGWEAYLGVYRLGIKRAREPHRPVVCVGNLVTGGSGKSPLTLHLAQVLRELGREVVVSCSGYGAPHAEAATLAPDGPLNPKSWGDEPAMLRWLMPDLPLVVGRRRVLAAEIVARDHPSAVMLMDDGFQHLPLRKHVSIVIDDPEPPNRLCLPAGPYREGRWNRRRANTVLPGEFQAVPGPMRFVTADGASSELPPSYSVLCALGQPERFVASLSEQRPPAAELLLPDHDPLDGGTLFEPLPANLPVVVTAKDWVKLRERADLGSREFIVALRDVRVEPQDTFRAWIRDKLNGRPA